VEGKKAIPRTIVVIVGLLTSIFSYAQDENTTTDLKTMLESKQYIFRATTANPSRGRTINLTSDYTLKVFNDSLIADLPYYGRAYSAPIGSDGGYNFTSISYDYSISKDKKNRWIISIKPKDVFDTQEFSLTVFENGSADLMVTSNNRQPISYRGDIRGRR
jgi:hypothetical protein